MSTTAPTPPRSVTSPVEPFFFALWAQRRQRPIELAIWLSIAPHGNETTRAATEARVYLGPAGLTVRGGPHRLPRIWYPRLRAGFGPALGELAETASGLVRLAEGRLAGSDLELAVRRLFLTRANVYLDLSCGPTQVAGVWSGSFADRAVGGHRAFTPWVEPEHRAEMEAAIRLLQDPLAPGYQHLRDLFARLPRRVDLAP